jgi:hypothetical protein
MTRPKKCKRVGIKHCEWCTTGAYKRIARRRERHDRKRGAVTDDV